MRHTTLDTLMTQVVEENARKHDVLADTRRMSVAIHEQEGNIPSYVGLTIDTDDGVEGYLPSEHMLGQMATDLGIPKRYFDRMKVEAPALFKRNVHHWLYEEPKRRMLRGYEDAHLNPNGSDATYVGRAWLSDRYRRLDNIEIASRLLPEFENLPVEFHNASITDDRFYLRAVFPRMEREVKVGEPVQWGVQIRNSEVGGATFAIESFMLVLACKNGMVVNKALNARHIGKRLDDVLSDEAVRADDKAFWLAARDTLRATLDESAFEEAIEILRGTTEGVKVQSVPRATERLAKTVGLSDEEQETVLTNLATGGDLTRWGMLNAVTATAHTVENFNRGVELEEIGWNIANLSRREWERIAVAA